MGQPGNGRNLKFRNFSADQREKEEYASRATLSAQFPLAVERRNDLAAWRSILYAGPILADYSGDRIGYCRRHSVHGRWHPASIVYVDWRRDDGSTVAAYDDDRLEPGTGHFDSDIYFISGNQYHPTLDDLRSGSCVWHFRRVLSPS